MPIDYSNTLIYKLSCKDPLIEDFYLGYTTVGHATLCERFKNRCKNDTWFVCAFIRTHGGFENWRVQRLALVSCSSSLEARTELRKHFDASTPSLNRHLPTRTNKEYAQTEKSKAKQEIYRGENKEKIHNLQRAIYQRNKEMISIKRREYYIANREECIRKSRAYRDKARQEQE